MEETREDAGPAERRPLNMSWWPSDFVENFESVSLSSQDQTLNNKELSGHANQDVMSPQKASQILWRTGMLSEPIPNGFYSVIPVSFYFIYLFLFLNSYYFSHSLTNYILIKNGKEDPFVAAILWKSRVI